MTAQSLSAIAATFSGDPNNGPTPVNGTDGFRLALDGTVQTLSTNNSPSKGPIKGALFVPSLQPHDPCNNLTARFVPSNITRQNDASHFGNDIIGLAPWISPACTQSFLNASQGAEPGALVFFHPSSNDTDKPPPLNDTSWRLDGSDWKDENNYPVYAIPGPSGRKLMHELSLYSHNSSNSTVQISASQHEEVRLYAGIGIKGEGGTHSIWGFILAILGSILVISVGLVVCYQFVQRRRRTTVIRRRIASGEVDLERLGLSHMKVPREVLEKLPIYPYPDLTPTPSSSAPSERDITETELVKHAGQEEHPDQPTAEPNPESPPAEVEEKESTPDSSGTPKIPEPAASSKSDSNGDTTPTSTQTHFPQDHNPVNRLSHSQTTCAICLDDFIPHTSTVRELPCGHIFHSTCIDTFLTENSCLCPLCKNSVLPPGQYRAPVSRRAMRREMSVRSRGGSSS